MLPTNDVVTPQQIAKLIQMVPATIPKTNLHAILSSGMLPDLFASEADEIRRFERTSLWRDKFRELVGLPLASIQLSFTVSKRSYREFARTCILMGTIPDDSHLRDVIEMAIQQPAQAASFGELVYHSRPKIVCPWFAADFKFRDINDLVRRHGYRVASLPSYLKFLTHISRRIAEPKLPSEIFEAPIVGALDHESGHGRFLLAKRHINPDSRGRTVTVLGHENNQLRARYWVPLEPDS